MTLYSHCSFYTFFWRRITLWSSSIWNRLTHSTKMWFAVSCMPNSNHSLGGLLTRGRQKCDVTQSTQTCAFDALHVAEDDNVVLRDYRKLSTVRSSIDELHLSGQSSLGQNGSDISPDFPERTYNSSTSSGYHSCRDFPHGTSNNSVTIQNLVNSYADLNLEDSPRVNRTFDENLLRKESVHVLRREKGNQKKDRNSYHGNWDVNDCHWNNNRNSCHGNLNITSYLKEGALWKNEQTRGANIDKLHYSKSFSDFNSKESHRTETSDCRDGARRDAWQVLSRDGKGTTTVSYPSPEDGRKNPMGVLSPGEHTRISPSHPREELPSAPCQCDNEHCDYYWRRYSEGGNLKTNTRVENERERAIISDYNWVSSS